MVPCPAPNEADQFSSGKIDGLKEGRSAHKSSKFCAVGAACRARHSRLGLTGRNVWNGRALNGRGLLSDYKKGSHPRHVSVFHVLQEAVYARSEDACTPPPAILLRLSRAFDPSPNSAPRQR